MYHLTRGGLLEESKPVAELPIGTKVFAFGAGMADQVFCITSGITQRGQRMCLVSNYYEDAYFSPVHYFDNKHCRPLSKKFGIGFYWDDIENVVFPESRVKAAIRRAEYLEKKISEKEKAIEEANKKEISELPARFPWLTPIDHKADRYKQLRANIVADLKHNFPDVKFSIKKRTDSSIYVSWVDGPAREKVAKVTGMYEDHTTDYTGDFRDFDPSNFNRVFGGINYVFEERDYSFDYEKLTQELAEKVKYETREASGDLYAIFCKTDIAKDAFNFRIETTGISCGSIKDFYKIAFDVPEKKVEKIVKKESNSEMVINGVNWVDYSEKSFAVFGNTKPCKELLKELGGKFNMYLKATHGFTFAGWIFPISKKQEVLEALGL